MALRGHCNDPTVQPSEHSLHTATTHASLLPPLLGADHQYIVCPILPPGSPGVNAFLSCQTHAFLGWHGAGPFFRRPGLGQAGPASSSPPPCLPSCSFPACLQPISSLGRAPCLRNRYSFLECGGMAAGSQSGSQSGSRDRSLKMPVFFSAFSLNQPLGI